MRLIKASITIKINEAKIYRENIIFNFVFALFPLFINVFLWKAVYGGNAHIHGYDLSQMMTYFLLVFFIDCVSNARSIATELSETVRDGTISNFLLKPVGFLEYQFSMFAAEKLIYLTNICVPLLVFLFLLRRFLIFHALRVFLFIISCTFALILNFLVYLIFGVLSVWIEEISSVLDLWTSLSFLLAGGAFPLNMLPGIGYHIISLLPFKYMMFTPINIYISDLSAVEMAEDLLAQVLWIAVMGSIFRILWSKAEKRFSGHGL